MKTWYVILMLLCIGLVAGCERSSDVPESIKSAYPSEITARVLNPLGTGIADAPVLIGLGRIREVDPGFNPNAWVAFADGEELAGQLIDGDEQEIVLITSLKANDNKTISLRYASEGNVERKYPKRTQAELSHKFGGKFIKNEKGRMVYEGGVFENVEQLRVPPEHTDHTFFVRYEGPGWESEKVGYRFYLDWRNATDIFGKKIPEPVLQNVGQDGFDSYHEMSDWGMDILKVGDALGLGAVGFWDGEKVLRVSETDSVICMITANGPVYSEVKTEYFGWQTGLGKFDLTSKLSILAGDRKTHHRVTTDPQIKDLCTGIVKHEGVKIIKQTDGPTGWGYLYTYGLQSLAGDSLGMALVFRNSDIVEVTGDNLNHVVIFKPMEGTVDFYFLAAWQQEPGGIVSEKQFRQYLENEILRLSQPPHVIL